MYMHIYPTAPCENDVTSVRRKCWYGSFMLRNYQNRNKILLCTYFKQSQRFSYHSEQGWLGWLSLMLNQEAVYVFYGKTNQNCHYYCYCILDAFRNHSPIYSNYNMPWVYIIFENGEQSFE